MTKADIANLPVAIYNINPHSGPGPLVGWAPQRCVDCVHCNHISLDHGRYQLPTCQNPSVDLHYLDRRALACAFFHVRPETNDVLRNVPAVSSPVVSSLEAVAAVPAPAIKRFGARFIEWLRDTEDLLLKISAIGGVLIVAVETWIRAVLPLFKLLHG
jgi:hypothetical protein